jgi:hypothetical protein
MPTISAKIENEDKNLFENIINSIGLNVTSAITAFVKATIIQIIGGAPEKSANPGNVGKNYSCRFFYPFSPKDFINPFTPALLFLIYCFPACFTIKYE